MLRDPQLRQLLTANFASRDALSRNPSLKLTGEQLRELRGYHELLPEQRKWARLPARVSGRSAPRSGRVLVVLDRGRRDGVRDGMPVISGCSLAGLVLEAHLASCVVALLTDPECRIRTFLRSELDPTDNGATASPPVGRHVGVAVGTSKGLTLQLVRIEQAPREGDLVLTSAFDGRTPTGLLVGRVGRVVKLAHEYQARVEVVPAVDLTQVDQLHILLRPAVPFPERQKKKEASKKPGKAISALQAAPSGR